MRLISHNLNATLKVRLLGFLKIPLMYFCRPRILNIDDESVTVVIPFKRKTKNHVGSMYIGALTVGADLAGGYLAMHHVSKMKNKNKLIFKDFHADFLKRAEGDVHLICNDGNKIRELVEEVSKSGERGNMSVLINAYVPTKFKDEPVAKFTLTLSIK